MIISLLNDSALEKAVNLLLLGLAEESGLLVLGGDWKDISQLPRRI